MKLDSGAAKNAIADLSRRIGLATMDVAMGIVAIVVSNMVRAIRVISVQRGYDPREFTLVAFGGAGPLHAGWVARELNLKRILIPKHPGLECAFGILVADMRSDFTHTRIVPPTADNLREINEIFKGLEAQGRVWLVSEGLPPEQQVLRHSVDMRYQSQNFELNVALPDQNLSEHDLISLQEKFHQIHEKNYGYFNVDEPTQIVTYRVEAIGLRPKIETNRCLPAKSVPITPSLGERKVYLGHNLGKWVTSQIYWREDLQPGSRISGPAIIEQMDTTTVILPSQNATVDNYLNLIITFGDDSGDESET